MKRSDEEIAQAAVKAIQWDSIIPSDKVKVIVEHGSITLIGEVEYNYQREKAYMDMKYLYGVKNVINNIIIKPIINIISTYLSQFNNI